MWVENYSNDYDVKCQLDTCKTYPAITDSERREIVCEDAILFYCKIWLTHHMTTTVTLQKTL